MKHRLTEGGLDLTLRAGKLQDIGRWRWLGGPEVPSDSELQEILDRGGIVSRKNGAGPSDTGGPSWGRL